MPLTLEFLESLSYAAGLALALEPTGWGVCGNVSRRRDQADKKLQDYVRLGIRISIRLPFILKKCPILKNVSISLTEEMIRWVGTNTSLGAITLLTPNLCASYTTGVLNPEHSATKAYSLVLIQDPSWFFMPIEMVSPSYIGKSSSTLLPTLKEKINRRWAERCGSNATATLLKNIPYDPVAQEILSAFTSTRKIAKKMATSTAKLDSSSIDTIFRFFAKKYTDYTIYRKHGIEKAYECMKLCNSLDRENSVARACSLGSISDLVALTIYYYVLYRLESGVRP